MARSLKLALMLWEEGQKREAVRTLQRGAEAAEEDGNDRRALMLARSAADLSANLPASVPPPATTSSPPPPVAPRDLSLDTSIVVTVEEQGPPSSDLVVPILVTPEGPDVAPVTPVVAAAMPGFPAPTPVVQPSAARPPTSAPRASSSPNPSSTPMAPRVAPTGRIGVPSVGPEKYPSTAPHPTNGASGFSFPVKARELRVSVKRSALDESLLVVRPLAPDAKPPTGSREAVLVFSEVDGE